MAQLVSVLLFVIVFNPLSIFAESGNPAWAPGCGDPAAEFQVKTDSAHATANPVSGKAIVYFIENDSNFGSFPKPTTRAGLDGAWVGAMHGDSYLFVLVDPGVHHLCASWQRAVLLGRGRQTAAAHFSFEAGGVYYFEVKNLHLQGESSEITEMTLTPLDSDEGRVLVNQFAFASSKLKK